MPVKILWDYLVYWSITGFIFMQGQMTHQTMYLRNMSKLSRLGKMNHFMQDFFRTWHLETADIPAGGCIDISRIPLIREMNQRLLDEMSNGQFVSRFGDNLLQLETLGNEIVSESGIAIDVPFKRSSKASIRSDAFETLFASIVEPTFKQDNVGRTEPAEIA